MITEPALVRIGEAVRRSTGVSRVIPCTLAHAMADVRGDLRAELVWDQRALAAAGLLTDARQP